MNKPNELASRCESVFIFNHPGLTRKAHAHSGRDEDYTIPTYQDQSSYCHLWISGLRDQCWASYMALFLEETI